LNTDESFKLTSWIQREASVNNDGTFDPNLLLLACGIAPCPQEQNVKKSKVLKHEELQFCYKTFLAMRRHIMSKG